MAQAGLRRPARPATELGRDGLAWVALGVGAAAYFVLSLWLTRDTTFDGDELAFFSDDEGFDLENIFTPHNGHLMALMRVIYAASFSAFGTDYMPMRLESPLSVIVAAVLLFILVKRRIGPMAAVPLALLVLLSVPEVTLFPVGTHIVHAVAAGVGAFLALEERSRGWDVVASVLLVLSVLAFSTGVGFVAGAAVWVLAGDDRWRRVWVVVPATVLYGAWRLWAQQFEEGIGITISNALLAPNYGAESLAGALASLAGLDYDFSGAGGSALVSLNWGRPLAVVVVIVLALRLARVGSSRSLLGFLAVLGALWLAGALVFAPLREPTSARYVYAIVVVVVLVASESARGLRLHRPVLVAIALIAAASLATHLVQLRDAGARARLNADQVRSQLAVLELEAQNLDPSYDGRLGFPVSAEGYLRNVNRHGSFAFSISEVQGQPEDVRSEADQLLAEITPPQLSPVRGELPPSSCSTVRAAPGRPLTFALPKGGAALRTDQPASLMLRRFASRFGIGPVELPGAQFTAIRLPEDEAEQQWFAAARGASAATVCATGSVDARP